MIGELWAHGGAATGAGLEGDALDELRRPGKPLKLAGRFQDGGLKPTAFFF